LRLKFAQTPALSEFINIKANDIYIKDASTGYMRKVSSNFSEKANLFSNSITGECTCNNLLSEVIYFLMLG
jgi:hypothetical protein